MYKSFGFSLIEVLVAVVIFSIGLLGVAALQLTTIKLVSDTQYRSYATLLANDMIDRMRANSVASSLGRASPYNNPDKRFTVHPGCYGRTGTGSFNASAKCTSTEMAENDFSDWYAAIRGASASSGRPEISALLPEGDGVVYVDSTSSTLTEKPIFVIKIWWVERKDADNPGEVHSYVTSFSI